MSRQFITCDVGDHRLGIEIMAVREIRVWTPTTELPGAAPHVVGIVNLRGVILPVTDLRRLLGWGTTDATERHAIMVVEVGGHLRGIIVDAVHDILTLDRGDIQPVPDVGNALAKEYLEGIATIDSTLVMVLSLAQLADPGVQLPEAA